LLAVVTLAAFPMAWVGYQLNWIRQRHQYIQRSDVWVLPVDPNPFDMPEAPWSLRLSGEQAFVCLAVPEADVERAKALFPEAAFTTNDRNTDKPH